MLSLSAANGLQKKSSITSKSDQTVWLNAPTITNINKMGLDSEALLHKHITNYTVGHVIVRVTMIHIGQYAL